MNRSDFTKSPTKYLMLGSQEGQVVFWELRNFSNLGEVSIQILVYTQDIRSCYNPYF